MSLYQAKVKTNPLLGITVIKKLFVTIGLGIYLVILFFKTLSPVLPVSSSIDINQLSYSDILRRRNYENLDKAVNNLQRDYESGKIDDKQLLESVSQGFYDSNPLLESNYDAWLTAYPTSYAAHFARGYYFLKRAWEVRGNNFINDTSSGQITAMESFLRQAMDDYNNSVPLTAKPILTYRGIIAISGLAGSPKSAEEALSAADQIDPKNFIVRDRYFFNLQPKWGGSLQAMIAFKEEAKKAGLSEKQLSSFDTLIDEQLDGQRAD